MNKVIGAVLFAAHGVMTSVWSVVWWQSLILLFLAVLGTLVWSAEVKS